MGEYIEREKIWPALNAACVPYNRATAKAIEDIPAADVRPVVLCRDCKYAERTGMGDGCVWCNENLFGRLDDDFCSRGEKREGS